MDSNDSKPPFQLCDEESSLCGIFSKTYFSGLTSIPWRTRLISGALPLNIHLRPLVASLAGTQRTELQALVWPHILHRTNVVFIENPLFSPEFPSPYETAMDSAYIVPLLLRIAESCGKRHVNQLYSEGPLAIIICLTVEECVALIDSIKMASQQFDRSFRVVSIFENPNDKGFQEKAYMAAENCDVLIVSLYSVMELFTTQGRLYQPPINLIKSEIVVFRNVDVMMRLDSELVEQILNRFMINNDTNFVLASSAASKKVKKLAEGFKTSNFTVITNYIDAILFEKLPIQLLDLHAGRLPCVMKAQKAIEGRVPGEKIIIHVSNDKESAAFHMNMNLSTSDIKKGTKYDFRVVKEADLVYETNAQIREWWMTETRDQIRILIIPDKYAGDFVICDADLVVHLSVPETLQKFMARFTYIKKAFMTWTSTNAAIAKGQGDKVVLPRMPCVIAVDEAWYNMLPLLVRVASSSSEHSVIPIKIVECAEKILLTARFLQIPVCLHLLYFGECIYKGSCARRHYVGEKSPIVAEVSSVNTIKIEFFVMRMINPSHFVVRILRCFQLGGKVISYTDKQTELSGTLSELAKNLPEPFAGIPEPGVICGMMNENSARIHRVSVVKRLDENFLHVHYLDEAVGMASLSEDYKHPKLSARVAIAGTKFFPLPNGLQQFPKTWTNLIVGKILPSHYERQWRTSSSGAVFSAMKSFILEKATMESKGIAFACEDFIFVDNLKCFKQQNGRLICALDIKNILKRFTHFTANSAHLEKLQKVFNEKLVTPCEPEPVSPNQSMTVPSQSSGSTCERPKDFSTRDIPTAFISGRGDYNLVAGI